MIFRLEKLLSVALAIAILVALGWIGYLTATPNPNEKFTEFYILGPEGKAENYPEQALLSSDVYVTVGVVNREYQPATYRVMITVSGVKSEEIAIGTLAHEQKWERQISFVAQSVGNRQEVEFWLYKDDKVEPYLQDPLRLYIDVMSPES
ncbi:MAG: DUF1616 domain-containing protein [Chloroflexota bacterium]